MTSAVDRGKVSIYDLERPEFEGALNLGDIREGLWIEVYRLEAGPTPERLLVLSAPYLKEVSPFETIWAVDVLKNPDSSTYGQIKMGEYARRSYVSWLSLGGAGVTTLAGCECCGSWSQTHFTVRSERQHSLRDNVYVTISEAEDKTSLFKPVLAKVLTVTAMLKPLARYQKQDLNLAEY